MAGRLLGVLGWLGRQGRGVGQKTLLPRFVWPGALLQLEASHCFPIG